MYLTKLVGKIKAHFMFNNFYFSEYLGVHEVMWKKYCRAGQATDDNMAHAYCMLDM
jgi:hypothetical protein